jgi:hypothetical protein
MLDKAGATLKEAMALARHSDPRLTAAVYGKARLHDLAGVIDRLPAFAPTDDQPQELAATGTDGSANPLAPPLAPRIDFDRHTDDSE